jgi:hypothetical protein
MLGGHAWPRARAALIANLSDDYGPTVGVQVDGLRTAIQRCFPVLDPFWNTGYGLTLQRIDAQNLRALTTQVARPRRAGPVGA